MTYYYVEIIVYLITIRFLKVYVDVQNVQLAGADPGFFLGGGGAPLTD